MAEDKQEIDPGLVLKELHLISRSILEFRDDIGRAIWHIEKRVESIQTRIGIDPTAQRAEHHVNKKR